MNELVSKNLYLRAYIPNVRTLNFFSIPEKFEEEEDTKETKKLHGR